MKFLILLLVVTIASLSCYSQQSDLVTIKGKLNPKGNYMMIYLDTLSQRGSEDFAAAEVKSDGSFVMTAPVSRTDIYKLRLDENNYLMLILSPGESLGFVSPTEKLGIDAIIRGSKHTELLYQAINLTRIYDLKRDSLNKAYNNAMTSPAKDSLSNLIIAEFGRNDSLQKVILKSMIRQEPGSMAWIFLQDKLDMNNDFPLIDRMEKEMYAAYPYNAYIQQYHQQIETERKTAVGSVAPDISLPDPEGNPRSLSSLRGKVVLIDFWASWCGPCRKENPNVVKAYAKYHDKGFDIFSVSLDKDRESWLKAITTDKLTWDNHVSDLKYWKSEGAAAYGVTSIPFTVLLDREGKIVAKKLRGDTLEQKLVELLK